MKIAVGTQCYYVSKSTISGLKCDLLPFVTYVCFRSRGEMGVFVNEFKYLLAVEPKVYRYNTEN